MNLKIIRSGIWVVIGLIMIAPNISANSTQLENTKENKTEQNRILSESENNKQPKTLESASHIGASDYLQMILGLMLIVAFIFAMSWFIKRLGGLNPNSSHDLKVVAGLSVGQREKIIVVQVLNEQILVGVTQSNIQLLSKLDEPINNGG